MGCDDNMAMTYSTASTDYFSCSTKFKISSYNERRYSVPGLEELKEDACLVLETKRSLIETSSSASYVPIISTITKSAHVCSFRFPFPLNKKNIQVHNLHMPPFLSRDIRTMKEVL